MNLNAVRSLLKKQDKRPILQCIHYLNNQMIVTDGYSLIIETQSVNIATPITIDVNTGKFPLGTYPDISKIIPQEHELYPVTSMAIKETSDGAFYYINDHKFNKEQVNKSFACFDIKKPMEKINAIKVKEKSPLFVYQENNYYILVLGLRKD